MKRIFATTLLIMAALMPCLAQSAATVLQQTADKFINSKGTELTFSFNGNGGMETGKMYLKGDKFCITSPSVTNIYNGEDMWSANAATNEVNIYTPEEEEIAEINPIAIITNATKLFHTRKLSSPASEVRILLTPKSDDAPLQSVTLIIDNSSKLPRQLTIKAGDGTEAVFKISDIKLNENINPSIFVFKEQNFKDYKIIDLR